MTDTLTSHDVENGELPEGWRRERIADVLAELPNRKVLNQGKSPQCEKEPSLSDEVWGVLKTTAIQSGKFLPIHNKRLPSSREPDESIEVANGDLLLTCAGPRVRCGVPCLVRETRPRLMLSGKMYRFRPNEELVGAEFLEGYLLSSGAQELIEGMKTGTSESGLNLTQGRFSELPVPIPPLSEQVRIVEILEDQLSRLDTALQSVHTVREKAAQFRRSLLHAAFTGSLAGYNVEEGELPEGWTRQTIGDISTVRGGKRLPKGTPWSQTPNTHPYVRATDIKHGKIKESDLVFVPEEVWDSIKRYTVKKGDVLISIAGTIGAMAVVGESLHGANLTENAAMISVDTGLVDPDYLCSYLQSPRARLEIDRLATSTTQAKLALFRIKTIEVSLPPLGEQERIVEILEEQLSRLDASLAVVDAVEERSAGLRRSLLHSAFTGRLTEEWREAVNV